MKKTSLSFSTLVLASFFLLVPSASAFTFLSNPNINVTEPTPGNLYLTGGQVTVEQKAAGDVVAVGGMVDLFQDVSGDVLAAGGQISIHGNVTGDVRVAGGKVRVSGNIGGDLVVMGGEVELERGATIAGGVLAHGGIVTLDGTVNGNVQGMMGVLMVRGWVNGSMEVLAEDVLNFSSSARVKGDLKYFSENPARIPAGVVSGNTERTVNLFGRMPISFGSFYPIWRVASSAFLFLSMLVLGGLFFWFMPGEVRSGAHDMRSDFWKNLGIGFAAFFLIPITALLFAVTVIGLPVAALLGMGMAAALCVSHVFGAMFVGNALFARGDHEKSTTTSKWRLFGRYALGLFLVALLRLVPVFGPIFCAILILLAFGTFIRRRYEMLEFLKTKKYWS
jgi:cytoskeletal protein CcmA (bactofilin family)